MALLSRREPALGHLTADDNRLVRLPSWRVVVRSDSVSSPANRDIVPVFFLAGIDPLKTLRGHFADDGVVPTVGIDRDVWRRRIGNGKIDLTFLSCARFEVGALFERQR